MGLTRGRIYWVDFGPPRGTEKAGRRPGVVLSINIVNNINFIMTVVPGTKGTNVTFNREGDVRLTGAETGLPLETVFEARQITAVDPRKIDPNAIGRLSGAGLDRVERAVRLVLGL